MKLIKIKKEFVNDKKESVSYYQVYLKLDNNNKIAIKCCFKEDNRILTTLAENE